MHSCEAFKIYNSTVYTIGIGSSLKATKEL
jgi:hypothetical protein